MDRITKDEETILTPLVVSETNNNNQNHKQEQQLNNQNPEYGTIIDYPEKDTTDTTDTKITETNNLKNEPMSNFAIAAILSTVFAYACIMTTFFYLTGPIECQRIEDETKKYYSYTISKSIALGGFAGLAGLAQLITPLIGLLSDCYKPNCKYRGLYNLGKRMPYLIIGTALVIGGLVGQIWSRSPIHPVSIPISVTTEVSILTGMNGHTHVVFTGAWLQYGIFFLVTMFGLNMIYTVMIVLIPDLGMYIKKKQNWEINPFIVCLLVLFNDCNF